MKERTSQHLFAYWNTVRGDRVAPRRFEIEPSRIAGVLPETFILEREARGDFRFRLAGTRICEQFGREFRGANLLDLFAVSDRETIAALLETTVSEGAVGIVVFGGTDTLERSAEFEMILLGLVHSGEVISRILGAISIAAPPAWLGSMPLTALQVRSTSVVWPDGRRHSIIEHYDHKSPFMRPAQVPAKIHRIKRRTFRVYNGGMSGD